MYPDAPWLPPHNMGPYDNCSHATEIPLSNKGLRGGGGKPLNNLDIDILDIDIYILQYWQTIGTVLLLFVVCLVIWQINN